MARVIADAFAPFAARHQLLLAVETELLDPENREAMVKYLAFLDDDE